MESNKKRIKHKNGSKEKIDCVSELMEYINVSARQSHCALCGKKISSTCHSHVVPTFILREIAEKGQVSYGYIFQKGNLPTFEKTTGIRNAHLFRLICQECDNKLFKDYEKPENILNFDELNPQLQKQMLCQMAIKAYLSHCQTKYKLLLLKDITTNGMCSSLEKQGILSPERSDLIHYFDCIDRLRKIENEDGSPFRILYDKLLDYKTDFATQTLICYVFDLEGRRIFNPNNLNSDNLCSYFYLMILPLRGKTRIVFYIEENGIEKVWSLVEQFGKLTDEEKLHFIFVSLIIHDQEFYIRPSIAKKILKNDKKLVRLYRCTDQVIYLPADNRKKITQFRKYNNYLLKDYGTT